MYLGKTRSEYACLSWDGGWRREGVGVGGTNARGWGGGVGRVGVGRVLANVLFLQMT